MSILLWLLSFLAYIGYMIYLMRRPPDLNLGLGLLALITGFVSFLVGRKWILILSFVFIFFGVIMTYRYAIAHNQFWLWVGGLGVTLFLGSLSLRDD